MQYYTKYDLMNNYCASVSLWLLPCSKTILSIFVYLSVPLVFTIDIKFNAELTPCHVEGSSL